MAPIVFFLKNLNTPYIPNPPNPPSSYLLLSPLSLPVSCSLPFGPARSGGHTPCGTCHTFCHNYCHKSENKKLQCSYLPSCLRHSRPLDIASNLCMIVIGIFAKPIAA